MSDLVEVPVAGPFLSLPGGLRIINHIKKTLVNSCFFAGCCVRLVMPVLPFSEEMPLASVEYVYLTAKNNFNFIKGIEDSKE